MRAWSSPPAPAPAYDHRSRLWGGGLPHATDNGPGYKPSPDPLSDRRLWTYYRPGGDDVRDRAARSPLATLFSQVGDDLTRLSRRLSELPRLDADTLSPDWRTWEPVLRGRLKGNADITFRSLAADGQGPDGVVVYVDNLVDPELMEAGVLRPMVRGFQTSGHWLLEQVSIADVTSTSSWATAYQHLFAGGCLLVLPGETKLWMADVAKVPHRSIGRPETEFATRGPQEAFTEVLALQMAQLRRSMPSPNLHIERLPLGQRIPTAVGVAWLAGVANDALIDEVRRRLQAIRIDMPVNATRIAAYLRDPSTSIFPTVRSSERVDSARFHLQQGKVLVLVDGDPFALAVPAVLTDFYRTPSDYTAPWYDASFIRLLRMAGWALGVFLPGLYVSLTEIDPRVVSPALLILLTVSHTGLPYNPIIEVLFMILTIELLREAAVRLPSPLGVTIGTVGAIVVGTAVVKAGLVSAQIIVVMTLAALSFFTAPVYELTATWRLMALVMLVAAFLYGLYGMLLGALWLSGLLIDAQSYGVPYLVPYSPWRGADVGDTLWRGPWTHLRQRLTAARAEDRQMAAPPPDGRDPGLYRENIRDDEG